MKFIFVFIILCSSIFSFGQFENELRHIAQIDSLVTKNVAKQNGDYICFSVRDMIVVVSKNKYVFYLDLQRGFICKELIQELSVDSLVNKNNIKAGKQFCNGDYSSSCIASFTYLSLNMDGKKIFQFNLPSMLLCSERKIEYPFDIQTLQSLWELLSSYFAYN